MFCAQWLFHDFPPLAEEPLVIDRFSETESVFFKDMAPGWLTITQEKAHLQSYMENTN